MIGSIASAYIASARRLKELGALDAHKRLLRMARQRYITDSNTTVSKGFSLTFHKADQGSVIVSFNPSLPGTDRKPRYAGQLRQVAVLGSPGHYGRGFGKSVALMLALSAMGNRCIAGEIIAIDEAESVPEGVWERLNDLKPRTIHLDCTPVDKDLLALIGRHKVRQDEIYMSRGEKIRRRKLFGGW